uniref:C-type lectin domain-containing protein n=1 Tax=Monopterus albus TaxID=43700 RepID=A0A3Q3JSC9_MONAL
MSCNIYEDPNMATNVRYSAGVQENAEERRVDIYESADIFTDHYVDLSTQDGGAHTLPAVQGNHFKAPALILALLCLLLLVGITVLSALYIPVMSEKNQLSFNHTRLKTIYENISMIYCQLQGKENQTQGNVPGWRAFRCSCYYKSTEKKNWTESRRECQERGADLVIITGKEEQKFVSELSKDEDSWIGLQAHGPNDKPNTWEREWKWKWVNGDTPAYLAWQDGVTVKPGEGLTAYISRQGQWAQTTNGSKQWICEKQI